MKSKSRNKIEKIIIGNLGNAILYEILAISVEGDMKKHYKKEMLNSFKVALKYRNELCCEIFTCDNDKIIRIVRRLLIHRICRGYKNISLENIDLITESYLNKLKYKN